MSYMHQAIVLNSRGVEYLTSRDDEQGKAMDCFRSALRIISSICSSETKNLELPSRSNHNERVHVYKSNPVSLDISSEHFSYALLIDYSEGDDSYENASYYSSIVIFNYALALHQKNGCWDDRRLQRASHLYEHTLELLSTVSDSFDPSDVALVADLAVHNLADTYYLVGDYQSFRCVLDSSLMLGVKNSLSRGNHPDGSSQAKPSAPAA